MSEKNNLKDLSMFQSAHVRWLKQQLNNLKDIKNRRKSLWVLTARFSLLTWS